MSVNTTKHSPTSLPPADPARDLDPYRGSPEKTYIICSSPRTGSTLLGRLLEQTGLAGQPHEYFHPVHMVPLAQRLGVISGGRLNVVQYVQALTRIRTSANGVFGVKAHFSQFAPLLQQGAWRSILPGDLHFICIERDDEIGQAISLAIARQTDCYSSESQPVREPHYDRNLIESSLQMIRSDKQGWRAFFRQNRITPAETTYENLVASPAEVCSRLCQAIGIVADSNCFHLGQTGIKKQANEINAAWRQRYVGDMTTGRQAG